MKFKKRPPILECHDIETGNMCFSVVPRKRGGNDLKNIHSV